MMPVSETLRVRVDKDTAKRVKRWAKQHDVDVSETLRRALAKLLDEEDRVTRIEAARKQLKEAEELGLFDPPRDGETWKAGGFR